MLKKAIRIFVSLSFILSISAYASMNVSAETIVTAGTSTYEIAQDFESINASSTSATLLSAYAASQVSAQIMTGPGSISGDKSLQVNFTTIAGYTGISLAASLLPKPTMASPTGVFYRIEFNKPCPESATGGIFMTTLDGAYGGYFASYTNMNGENAVQGGYGGFHGRIIGYIFFPVSATWTTDKILGWDVRADIPDNSAMLIDEIGYYTGTDYAAIADSLNESHTLNPILLQGCTPGTYNDTVIPDNPIKMQIQAYHQGSSTILWSSSVPTVATIDADGNITAKKKGDTVITASLSADPTIKTEKLIHVALGDINLTSKDLNNEHSAIFGLKVVFRAAARFYSFDKEVIWSVVSGPATIVPTELDLTGFDSDIASEPDVTAVLASFSDSGKVIIRAALAAKPTIYSDYSLVILPSFKQLQKEVLEAEAMNPGLYTTTSWNKMLTVVDAIYALIDAGPEKTTQSKINSLRTDLAKAISALATGQGTESEPDDDNGNPQTGSESLVVLTLTVILLGGLIITFKKEYQIISRRRQSDL